MARAKPVGMWIDPEMLGHIRRAAAAEVQEINRLYRSRGCSQAELTERSRRNVVIQALLLHIDAQRSLIVHLERYLVGAVKGRPSFDAKMAAATAEVLQRPRKRR